MPIFLQALKTLRMVLLRMWQRWYVIVGCIFLCLALVLAFARSRPPQYTTIMIAAPAETGGSSLSGAMSALSGAGSGLLGLVGGGRSPQFDNYVLLLQSQSVSKELMKNPHIMSLLFGKAIDSRTGEWKKTFSRNAKNALYAIFGIQRPAKPTWDNVQILLNAMLVTESDPLNKTRVTVSCTTSDTTSCRDILLAVHNAAQARLDKITLESTRRTVADLSNVLTGANEVSLRQALTTIIASTQVQAAISSIGQNRTTLLDEPIAPALPVFPKPVFLIEMAVFAGLLLGAFFVWIIRDTALDRFLGRNARKPGARASKEFV